MKNILSTSLIILLSATGFAQADSSKPHWGYSGHEGPEHWGELDASYAACANGKNQSPINLSNFVEAELEPLGFDYGSQSSEILNNGHTVQVNFTPGSTLVVDGRTFELKQVHFHTPSENVIDGKPYAMEAHFVHADPQGNLAVVAVMFDQGTEHAVLAKLWSEMPEKAGDKHPLVNKTRGDALMPGSRDYFRFAGSLTTPPCTEGVIWLVMKEALTASKEQIARFAQVMHHPNNRPVQPLNGRMVMQ
jgi:carbonic anhydrase